MLPDVELPKPELRTSRTYFTSFPRKRQLVLVLTKWFFLAFFIWVFVLSFFLVVEKFALSEKVYRGYFRFLLQQFQDSTEGRRIPSHVELFEYPLKKFIIFWVVEGEPHAVIPVDRISHLEIRDLEQSRVGEIHTHHFRILRILDLTNLLQCRDLDAEFRSSAHKPFGNIQKIGLFRSYLLYFLLDELWPEKRVVAVERDDIVRSEFFGCPAPALELVFETSTEIQCAFFERDLLEHVVLRPIARTYDDAIQSFDNLRSINDVLDHFPSSYRKQRLLRQTR